MEAVVLLIYQVRDIAGAEVFTISGERLGTLVDVLPAGGNDVWVIQDGKKEILLPGTHGVIKSVDVEAKRITVELPTGLREVYES